MPCTLLNYNMKMDTVGERESHKMKKKTNQKKPQSQKPLKPSFVFSHEEISV